MSQDCIWNEAGQEAGNITSIFTIGGIMTTQTAVMFITDWKLWFSYNGYSLTDFSENRFVYFLLRWEIWTFCSSVMPADQIQTQTTTSRLIFLLTWLIDFSQFLLLLSHTYKTKASKVRQWWTNCSKQTHIYDYMDECFKPAHDLKQLHPTRIQHHHLVSDKTRSI